MANNRMWLVHDESGQRVHLASHFGGAWKTWTDDIEGRLNAAWKAQADSGSDCTPWGSTGWHLEFECHSVEHDDPIKPNTVER